LESNGILKNNPDQKNNVLNIFGKNPEFSKNYPKLKKY